MSEVTNIITTTIETNSKLIFIAIAVVMFPLLVTWEWFNHHKRVTSDIRKQSYTTNLLNLVFNNLILLLLSIEWFYQLANQTSLSLLPRLFNYLGLETYSLYGIAINILILDFLIYFWHWLNHQFDFFWNFHKVHHSDKDLNTSTGIRFHIGELLLSLLYKGLIILALGMPVEIITAFEFITVFATIFHHSNIKLPGESWLRYILIMPIHHATHHSVPRKHHDSNYGVLFSWWDYIFKTFNPHQPSQFGLANTKGMNLNALIRFGLITRISVYAVIILTITAYTLRWLYI